MSPETEGVIEDNELTKDQILELLSSDGDDETGDDKLELEEEEEDTEDKEDEKGDKEEKEDKKLKLKDEEDEEKEGDDEEIVTHLRRKEILKDFPDLFKKHPGLEKAWYKEQRYTEMFGTLDDAKEILEKAGTLDEHEKSLMEGDTQTILQAVKDSDEDAWNKVVDGYLPALAKVDKDSYFHVLGDVIKNTVISMANEAKRTDNKQLQAAAQLVNQFVFGTSEFQAPFKLSKTNDTENDKLEADRAEFLQERFEIARDELDTKIRNVLKASITEHIDPKDAMTTYVKRQAIREVVENVQELIDRDSSFAKVIDNLWKKSSDTKFSPVTTKKIRSVYLSKAQTLLPSVIKRIRREALKDSGKKITESRSKSPERTRVRSSHKGSDDGKGMSTLDYFNED